MSVLLLIACMTLVQELQQRTVWDGVYSQEQAKRGEQLYRKECGSCHGSQLMGGESAPPLAGGEFLSNWNGLSVSDLAERIRKTMPSGRPGKLSRKENVDVIAFVFSANDFPAGDAELPEKPEQLKEIRVEMQKPERKK